VWNGLPPNVVGCDTTSLFKRHLEQVDLSEFITEFVLPSLLLSLLLSLCNCVSIQGYLFVVLRASPWWSFPTVYAERFMAHYALVVSPSLNVHVISCFLDED